MFQDGMSVHVEFEAVYEYYNLRNMQESKHLPLNATQN
jgi:hypothetical protein